MRTAFACSVVILAATVAVTQPLEIPGPPPSTNGNLIPWSPQWTAASGEYRYQLVVPSSLLGSRSMVIDEVAFRTSTPALSTFTSPMFEIRMSHTTQVPPSPTFALNLPNPRVAYPAGPITYVRTAGQWSPIRLPIPFVYDGSSSLTVEIRYANGTSTDPTGSRDVDTNQASFNYYRVMAWGRGAYNAAAAMHAAAIDFRGIYMRLDGVRSLGLLGSGTGKIGSTIALALRASNDVGFGYQVVSSLGTGPTPIGGRSIALTVDPLFVASVQGVFPTVFVNYVGTITAPGRASAGIVLPPFPALVGIQLHSAFVTFGAGGIRSVSNTWSFGIQA